MNKQRSFGEADRKRKDFTMARTVRICGLCGKEYKSWYRYQVFNIDFCSGCYGYVLHFCKTPEDVQKRTIDELKALYKKKTCDLCGEKVSRFRRKYVQDGVICKDCEHLLRMYYNNNAEKCAAVISNALILALSFALETALDGCGVDDPMERATIAELKKLYEMMLVGESSDT